MTIPEKIRYQRMRLGLNQTELGERLGVKTNAVSKWETGKVADIPASKIKKMAELFGVRPSYLIDDDEAELSGDQRKILAVWNSASDVQKKKILDIMEYVLSQAE